MVEKGTGRRKGLAVVVLMLLQGFCAAFFVTDVVGDYFTDPHGLWSDSHLVLEILANLGLLAGITFEAAYLRQILRRQEHTERALSVASGALQEVVQSYFADWKLTPSEADVAGFTIKGLSIAEIASLRGSAEGTVKTHLNSIYRKAGVSGRAQLVNLLIEELMGGPIVRSERIAQGEA